MKHLLFFIAWLFAAPAIADETRPASIEFVQITAESWDLAWRHPRAGPAEPILPAPELPSRCRYLSSPRIVTAGSVSTGSARANCAGDPSGGRIGWAALPAGQEALLRVAPRNRPVQVHRISFERPAAVILARPERAQVWRSYGGLGVRHILSGWDHLLFVVALVLLVAQPWPVIKAATAFTLAHSVTLAAVTLGYAGLPQRPVEALIALSIVFLAVEIARRGPSTMTRRQPWAVAFVFGLLHGFGFAGALREIGLPEGEVPAALLSFNLGVEAGQLLVVGGIIGLRALVRRNLPALEGPAVRLSAYAIGITGSFWLIDRLTA